MVHFLQEIAPAQAQMFLQRLSLEFLVQNVFTGNMNLVRQLIEMMRELGLPAQYIERFVEAIGVEWFVQKAEKENLQHLYWMLNLFQRVAPALADALLDVLTAARLAEYCRTKEVSIGMVGQFSKVTSKPYWQQFLRQFSIQDMAAIFNRSPMGAIGSFLKPRYFYFRQSYQLFRDMFLLERLQTEPLEEIGKFLARIRYMPEVGDELVYDVVSLLMHVDIVERVASTDIRQFALLLYNAGSVHRSYLFRLLTPLEQPAMLCRALEKSELESIQTFIHNVAGIDNTPERRYMQDIHCAMRAVDMNTTIITAKIPHIASFLWNVYSHIDQELAQEYCQLIDRQDWTMQFRSASLVDIYAFLWSLVAINHVDEPLQVVREPAIKERLAAAWGAESGQAAMLLGVLLLGQSPLVRQYVQPEMCTQEQRERIGGWLVDCLDKGEALMLAFTLNGLRSCNQAGIEDFVQDMLPVERMKKMLLEAKDGVVMRRLEVLLDDVLRWIAP
jgi:hypothetical protein